MNPRHHTKLVYEGNYVAKIDVGYGSIGFRGGDQQARLPDEEDGLNLRQSCDATCDIPPLRLATFALYPN